jgi:hypothetical protein
MRLFCLTACAAWLVLSGCSKEDSAREQTGYADSNIVATSSTRAVLVREAGIRFDPPSVWPRDRYWVDAKAGEDADSEQPRASHVVTVVFRPAQAGKAEAPLCRLIVFAQAEWKRIEAEAGPPVGTVLESLDEWVYVVQLPQSNPYRPGSPESEQFEAMRLSIREVRARFSVEGDGPARAEEL